jgi:bifunctional UDP-N-acetylglucosamine pyrophosphorylase/glucosamine-1-phosphate N-acetyltransferase
MALAIAILAAGKGTRLHSTRAKVLHEIGGKALLQHVVDTALQVVPPADVYVIVGHQSEKVRAAVAHSGVQFVEQKVQKGTGHAIQEAAASLRVYEHVLVLSGDSPLLKSSTVKALRDFHLRERGVMTILSAEVEEPFGYGRIVRAKAVRPGMDAPEVQAIVEQKSLEPGQDSIREINSGMYAFEVEALMGNIDQLQANNNQGEVYLTDLARILHNAGQRVLAYRAPSHLEALGANTIAEMMELDSALRKQTALRHMAAGVTIFQPETVVIDSDVQIGADTVIEPFAQLRGTTRVGTHSLIQSYSVLTSVTVGDHVQVRQGCILEDSTIGDGAMIGPYARMRPRSIVEKGVHVGNFVELKNTHMHEGAKANHLAYLGDTEIGAGANIGAGTIVCNYDGVDKHKTQIGTGAFIGSDSVLVAPLIIGDGAYVAAASCVTQDVPAGALAVGRARQENKPGWATTRRSRQPIQNGKP